MLENVSAMMTVEGHIRITDIGEQKLTGSLNIFREILETFWFCRCRGLDEKFVQSI